MSRLSDLLEQVVANREDDAPRLVYADALLEVGEPQGEFIQVQCALARGGLSRDEAVRLRRRERELLDANEARWTAGLQGLALQYAFARGLVDEVICGAPAWIAQAPRLFEAAPALRSVTLSELNAIAGGPTEAMLLDRLRRALAAPELRRLIGVEISAVFFNQKREPFDNLETIGLGDQAMAVVAAADLGHLRGLGVNGPGPVGMMTLSRARVLGGLERLSINSGAWPADPSAVLRALDPARVRSLATDEWHPALARLSRLEELQLGAARTRVPKLPPTLERLEYRSTTITLEDLNAINGCPRLEELSLVCTSIPLEQLRLPKLRVLRVYCNELTALRVQGMKGSPSFERLEVLELNKASPAERAELERLLGCVVQLWRPRVSMLYAR